MNPSTYHFPFPNNSSHFQVGKHRLPNNKAVHLSSRSDQRFSAPLVASLFIDRSSNNRPFIGNRKYYVSEGNTGVACQRRGVARLMRFRCTSVEVAAKERQRRNGTGSTGKPVVGDVCTRTEVLKIVFPRVHRVSRSRNAGSRLSRLSSTLASVHFVKSSAPSGSRRSHGRRRRVYIRRRASLGDFRADQVLAKRLGFAASF